MSEISFRNNLNNFAKDGIVDKKEFQQLKEIAKSDKLSNADSQIAEQVVDYLGQVEDVTDISYEFPEYDGHEANTMKFTFQPNYSESEKVPGTTVKDKISNISQGDSLKGTDGDDSRCCAGSLINASLLMGTDFSSIAFKTGSESDMTYENVHQAQEKLYDRNNKDGESGITAGSSYSYDTETGKIDASTVRLTGEVKNMAKQLNLTVKPLVGETKDTVNNKEESVKTFLAENNSSTLLVGVNMDADTGVISSPSEGNEQNHFVTVFKQDGDFYVADTGQPNNGKGENVRKLSQDEVSSLVYNTSGFIGGVTKNN